MFFKGILRTFFPIRLGDIFSFDRELSFLTSNRIKHYYFKIYSRKADNNEKNVSIVQDK